jgi:hypothetical protein
LATKTLACPECGAAVAPVRYACAECGAMLAAVGTLPRSWPVLAGGSSEIVAAPSEVTSDLVTSVPPAAVEEPPAASKRPRRPKTEPIAAETPAVMAPHDHARAEPARAIPEPPLWVRLAEAPGPAPTPTPRPRVPSQQPAQPTRSREEPSPLQPAAAAPAPPSRGAPKEATKRAAGPGAIVDRDDVVRSEPEWPATLPETPRARVAVDRPPTLPAVTSPAPGWPPLDERPTTAPAPAIRTPAGAYLAPSAVLPPLDAPHAFRNGHAPASREERRGPAPLAEGRSRPSLAESLDAMGITADMPRRLVGGGAAMAILGFLLPWVNVLGGGGALINDYLSYWGLAGPGHWLVAAALLALVAVAFAEQTFAQLRVGAIAVATAALLVGLLWTYLFGVPGKSVGVWIVLAGAALIAIGGALDLRRRHGPEASAV